MCQIPILSIFLLVIIDQDSNFALFFEMEEHSEIKPRLECHQMIIPLQTLFAPYLQKYLHHF